MAEIRQPSGEHRHAIEDSLRWRDFEHRSDDIFISTPPKSGTTWMQGIVSSLLWPAGDAPGDRNSRSPWVDVRSRPIDDVLAHLAQQEHRRFIKTHSPADCVPIFEECRYVTVYRDGRDALMSWANHRGAMRSGAVEWLNARAEEEGLRPLPSWSGDMDELFDQWVNDCSPFRHLASWWPLRHEDFSYFAHDNDLQADLEGEMRRLAAFLGIEVPADLWPDTVRRCGLTEMREDARGDGWTELVFENGADSFFYEGMNARWRGVLTPISSTATTPWSASSYPRKQRSGSRQAPSPPASGPTRRSRAVVADDRVGTRSRPERCCVRNRWDNVSFTPDGTC